MFSFMHVIFEVLQLKPYTVSLTVGEKNSWLSEYLNVISQYSETFPFLF